MRILWITLESILPANTGGRIGVFKRLEQLSQTNEIYLFYPYDNESELTQVNELKKYCKKVYPYSRTANKKHGLVRLLKYPFTVGSREFSEMKRDIKLCIEKERIDVINVDFPHMCVNLLDMDINVPIVLNEHNIEWKVYRTVARSHKNVFKKIAYYIDSYRLQRYEKKLLKLINFAKVTFVSTKDKQHMIDSGDVSLSQAVLIPVGADIQDIKDVPHVGKNIIFVGKMSYGPNIEAVIWFAREIFPQIKRKILDVKFYIVGKDPAEDVIALQTEDIIVTGMVDDIKDYYGIADLVVLPLKNGGGVKVKLLEAISYKKPIVSTSVGVEGTLFSKGRLIPICDNAGDFASQCIKYITNKNEAMVDSIYEIFCLNYTWDEIGKKYYRCFEDCLLKGTLKNGDSRKSLRF